LVSDIATLKVSSEPAVQSAKGGCDRFGLIIENKSKPEIQIQLMTIKE
jgi:hypothetical protein